MERVIWCFFGCEQIRPTAFREARLQITQFLVEFADILESPSFRLRPAMFRVE
jgi:hypothetical protein